MKVKIHPTEKMEKLKQNIEKRVKDVEVVDGKIIAETEEPGKLGRVPGIESYSCKGERFEGIGGSPVDEQAYARLESKRDAVRNLLATVEGYNLVVLDTERIWDLKHLRRYNPDIKLLKTREPVDSLGIESGLAGVEEVERVEIKLPDEKIETIYREMLT